MIQDVQDNIRSKRIQNVCARQTILETSELVCPIQLLQTLHAESLNDYVFYVQHQPHDVFLGASPERLLRYEEVSWKVKC